MPKFTIVSVSACAPFERITNLRLFACGLGSSADRLTILVGFSIGGSLRVGFSFLTFDLTLANLALSFVLAFAFAVATLSLALTLAFLFRERTERACRFGQFAPTRQKPL